MITNAILCITSGSKTSAFISVFQLESWPGSIRHRFSYRVYSIRFPNENAAEWKKLFKPCASQRLFLPVSCNIILILKSEVEKSIRSDFNLDYFKSVKYAFLHLHEHHKYNVFCPFPAHLRGR